MPRKGNAMKKLLLWLVMVVVMLAVLLGGAGYAMYLSLIHI